MVVSVMMIVSERSLVMFVIWRGVTACATKIE